jgi:putative membrane protein
MKSTLSRLFAAAISLPAMTAPGWAQAAIDRGQWGYSDWGWGHMMFGGATMLVFWGGIILLIVLLVRGLGGFRPAREVAGPSHPTALEVLQERYARGEIDKQEYEERRKTLTT